MSRIKLPLVVKNPVFVTRAQTGESPTGLVYMTAVPPYKVYLLHSDVEYTSVGIIGKLFFITGIDSPVRIASFTIALPVSNTKSHGNTIASGTLMMSPGTS